MQRNDTNSPGTTEELSSLVQAAHLQALCDEEVGVRHRIQNYYLPLFLQHAKSTRQAPESMRVLDCGCGNGASAE